MDGLWNMIDADIKKLLMDRGYTVALCRQEHIRSVVVGENNIEGVKFYSPTEGVSWVAQSMSGALIGIQVRELNESSYSWWQAEGASHLPMLYGSERDYELLYRNQEMMLVEGIFDRVALKRAFPDRAIFARMSKGIANNLKCFIKRYADRIWLAFDMDDPGRNAIEKARQLEPDVEVLVLKYPAKDPSELYKKRGVSKMRGLLSRQIRIMES